MSSEPLTSRMRCLVLKGAGFSQEFLSACYGQALCMMLDGTARFDAQGDGGSICIVDSGRYQVLGGFGGRLFTVNLESDEHSGEMTFLVDSRIPSFGSWAPVALVDGRWTMPGEEIYN